ncbi:unnamed protein product [Brassica rapa]|uniref:DUF7086 domain-containing protein n=3 Tax=Brassica campestris TaxID=3711 RepID=A0A3P5YU07_BRACM|nr:unnamed protein product [Brassica rapa]VDC71262.1 unnamed protein product [Brassica rapa]
MRKGEDDDRDGTKPTAPKENEGLLLGDLFKIFLILSSHLHLANDAFDGSMTELKKKKKSTNNQHTHSDALSHSFSYRNPNFSHHFRRFPFHMDNNNGIQRRRAIGEDDQTSNQRRRTNPAVMVTNEPQNDGVQSEDDNNNRSGRRVWEDDRAANQVVVMNEPRNDGVQTGDDDDARLLPLSLSLRPPTSYSSQISPPPLRLAPPSPVMQTPRYLMTRPYFATPPSYLLSSSLSYSTPPYAPSFDFLTPARPVATAVESTRRSYRSQSSRNRKEETIPPPYPWATNKRGTIQSLENLESKQITTITGDVQCKHCDKVYQISYNLREKFSQVENVFVTRKRLMRERAPTFWTNPDPMRCDLCGRDKAVKPLIAERKSQINWLFLLLGQMLGYCTLEQLKNFCKHSRSHRTGAKDRVLYLTYLGLCKMLDPNRDLFNRETSRW